MKYLYHLSLLVFFFLFSCTPEKQSKIYEFTIDPGQSSTDLKLSQICDEIEYIPIEPGIPIGRAYNLKYSNGTYVLTSSFKAYYIDSEGSIESVTDNNGRGPGEYSSLMYSDINPGNNDLIIGSNNKVLYYDKNGNVIKEAKPENPFEEVFFVNDTSLLIYKAPLGGENLFSFSLINSGGETIWSKNNHINFNPTLIVAYTSEVSSYRYNKNLFVKEMMSDTLYFVDHHGELVPYAIFNTGELAFTSEKRENTINGLMDAILVRKIFETTNQFILKYRYNGYRYWMADKILGETSTSSSEGFKNDLDGGMFFSPEYQIADDYLVQVVDAYKFNSWLKDDKFKSFDGDPEAKDKFRKLAESLRENDNPVIIKCKLK